MTFRRPDESRIIKSMCDSIYYWHNRDKIQTQQKNYREKNKEKVKSIWRNSRRKYDRKNKQSLVMYTQLINLAKKEGML